MAALSREAHRSRVLEHQAMVGADRSTPVSSSSDPQLKIRLICEVRCSDETVEPKRARPASCSLRAYVAHTSRSDNTPSHLLHL